MSSYAFWNNKGGVGKSYLCFVAAAEYAHRHPNSDVYVIDLCPQANVSETLLGGNINSPKAINSLYSRSPRATVAGYIEERLSSPFRMIDNIDNYIVVPSEFNKLIPTNLYLVCGDNLLEILAEAMRQTSQLSVPIDAWKQVVSWIKDLNFALQKRSGDRDSMTMIDCNPSFAIFTQLALVAADNVIVPFTADDSSRRGIENVVALLYGITDPHTSTYARISFSKLAKDGRVDVPKLHTFVCNRVTFYEGRPSRAFEAVSKTIKGSINLIHERHRSVFKDPSKKPSDNFIEIPDYHSASIVSAVTGTPIHRMKSGPRDILGERVQINPEPLAKYSEALGKFVDTL